MGRARPMRGWRPNTNPVPPPLTADEAKRLDEAIEGLSAAQLSSEQQARIRAAFEEGRREYAVTKQLGDGPTRKQVHAAARALRKTIDALTATLEGLDDLTIAKLIEHGATAGERCHGGPCRSRVDRLKASNQAIWQLQRAAKAVEEEMKMPARRTFRDLLSTPADLLPDRNVAGWTPLGAALYVLASRIRDITGNLPKLGWNEAPKHGACGYGGSFWAFARLLADVVGDAQRHDSGVGKTAQDALTSIRKNDADRSEEVQDTSPQHP